jgi:protein-tyrosine-phosphatase
MAAALLERHGSGKVKVSSAGSDPADRINPAAIEALAEWGIDISSARPRRLATQEIPDVDVVVTMGCGDACPVYPGTRYLDWDVPDPAGLPLEAVRPIRDEIDRRVRLLAAELGA